MPLYEYRCTQCFRRVEIIQKVGGPPLEKCMVCGGAMKKVISSPAIQFKGSGWYITDYAKRSSPEKSETQKEASAKSPEASGKDTGDKKTPAAAPSKD
jgi:putative FmdB family regulatory protein